jgi:hypothetical protein
MIFQDFIIIASIFSLAPDASFSASSGTRLGKEEEKP